MLLLTFWGLVVVLHSQIQSPPQPIAFVHKEMSVWCVILESCCLVMFADRGHIKIYRKRSVSSEPLYVTLAVTEEDRRDVLGIFNISTEKRNRME